MKFLKKAYNRKDYLDFLRDKFNFSEFIQAVPINNSDVKSFEKLGLIITADDKELPIFEIHIKPNTKLERNRVQLRKLVAEKILTEDGAIAVYIDDKNKQWRFSFIAIEPKWEGGVKTEETSSKRFTYLFGEGEGGKTRTAIQRFKTLNKQSTLSDLKTAFAVEGLNKEFYDKLYQWYEKAQKKVIFPNDEKDENHIQTNLIRFLTRILFVWFLKEKKLINQDLFDLEKLKDLIDYEKDSSFYKAILQNLFFATLSTKIKDRKFRSESKGHKGYNLDFGNQYVFRYQKLFQEQDSIQDLFNKTPFLNGGLFECLDDKKNKIYIDGFSSTKKRQPIFPNKLLFNDDEQDLGLIDLFNQYQFTIEESTPTDIEVALDPELLGKVFENLLATYNPETGEQARKATGSFYTPREIVSYMVDESLKQHFKTHTDLKENTINTLFIENENKLDKPNKRQINSVIKAIDELKILDPAVGSGAYPMGILQRLVFILEKIDPENTYFKQQQLEKLPNLSSIEQDLKTVGKISDEKAKEKATEELNRRKIEINTEFARKDHNYLRKLHLIENCIYGVDIQPIAIQICKLRFFISLTIEQEKKEKKHNFGITPLPNLDYHFEIGNSLIGLPNDYQPDSIKTLLQEIQPLKHQFFSENNTQNKKKLRDKIQQKISTCYAHIEKSIGYKLDFDFKIDFSEVFDKTNGFDIVIGNPPYIKEYGNKNAFNIIRENKKYYQGKMDIWTFFACMGIDILKENAVLSFIAPNNWVSNSGASKARNKILKDSRIIEFIDFGNFMIFENASIQTMILILKKKKCHKYITKFSKVLDSKLPFIELVNFLYKKPDQRFLIYASEIDNQKLMDSNITFLQKNISDILDKIEACKNFELDKDNEITNGLQVQQEKVNKKSLKVLGDAFSIGDGIFNLTAEEKDLLSFQANELELIKPLYTSKEISKYYTNKNNQLWVVYTNSKFKNSKHIKPYPNLKKHLDKFQKVITTDNKPYGIHRTRNELFFKGEKILSLRKSPNQPSFSYVDFDSYVNQAFYVIKSQRINLKYLIALLNSKLIAFWLKHKGKMQGDNYQIDKEPILNIPIKKALAEIQQPLIDLADKILTAKKSGTDTTTLETQIDNMVYQLYDLTADEIKIIETSK